MSLSASPQEALAVARARELAALTFIYYQGMATAAQVGRHILGPAFHPQSNYHLTLCRRLRTRRLLAFINSPAVGERIYFLTDAGRDRLRNGGETTDFFLPRVDFHGGRSGVTVGHDLSVNNLRLAVEAAGLEFISERVIRAAWGEERDKIPDGLLGRRSDLDYWQWIAPLALEYEHSSRSEIRRLLMIKAAENLIGRRVAGVVLVATAGVLNGWKKSLARAEAQPSFEVLGRSGKHLVRLDASMLRFWTLTPPEGLPAALLTARVAHRKEGRADWSWDRYQPWLHLQSAAQTLPRPTAQAYTQAYKSVLA